MKDTLKQAARKTLLVIRDIGVSLLGITGWLFHALLALVTAGFILGAILCLLIYAKVKPDLDECRELAYDKLAQMERTDFSKLSDTVIYDKDGRQIGLINAGHYQYVGITGISMNIQNAYIAQEDRRFKSHTGVDWIATFRAGLALVKHRGQVTQGGSTITQQVIRIHTRPRNRPSPARSWKSCWPLRLKRSTPKQILWSFTAIPISMATSATEWKLPAAIISASMRQT